MDQLIYSFSYCMMCIIVCSYVEVMSESEAGLHVFDIENGLLVKNEKEHETCCSFFNFLSVKLWFCSLLSFFLTPLSCLFL